MRGGGVREEGRGRKVRVGDTNTRCTFPIRVRSIWSSHSVAIREEGRGRTVRVGDTNTRCTFPIRVRSIWSSHSVEIRDYSYICFHVCSSLRA